MESANLDLVRSICEAWERGDYSNVDWAHPDIEFVIADGPSPGRWTGLSGMTEGVRTWLSPWDELRQEPVEYREIDDERVLEVHAYSGRAKKSGLKLDQLRARAACVFYIGDGKVTKLVLYWDRESAIADLSLASEDSPRA